MSDFTIEQLRALFENLADRLDKTSGDKLGKDELERIRAIMDKTQKSIGKQAGKGPADPKAFINEFFNQWAAKQPLKELSGRNRRDKQDSKKSSSPGPDTIIGKKLAEADAQAAVSSRRNSVARSKIETGIIGSMSNMRKGLDGAAGGLMTFTNNLKSKGVVGTVIGGAVGKMTADWIKEKGDAYRSLIASGDGQLSSIQQMNNVSNSAGMSADE
jgi:hypothetical protein